MNALATVRLRQRATKGSVSRTKVLFMVFKLLAMTQPLWRKPSCYLQLVRAGVKGVEGVRQEREKEKRADEEKAV